MKKCLSLLIALSMVLAMCVIPVSATEAAAPAWLPEGATLIFAEDFEEGYAEGNLLTQLDADGNYSKADGTKVLWFNAKAPEQQTASVEAGPEAFNTSKVLKLTNSAIYKNGTAVNQLVQKFLLNNGADYKRTAGTQLIIQYDVMIAGAKLGATDGVFMTYDSSATKRRAPSTMSQWTGTGIGIHSGNYATSSSSYALQQDWYIRPFADIKTKQTIRVVVEQDMGNFDSARMYYGNADTLLSGTGKVATDWNNGRKFKDYIGGGNSFLVGDYTTTDTGVVKSTAYNNELNFLYNEITSNGKDVNTGKDTTEPTTLYFDNIRVYEVPGIKFTGLTKNEGVSLADGVVVNFDQPFTATADDFKISLAEDDTWIEGAVSEVIMAEDKKSATIKFNTSVFGENTQFKLWIDDEFTSDAGAIFHKDLDGVLASEEYVKLADFATLEIFGLVGETEEITNLVPNDPRNINIEVTGNIAKVEATLDDVALNTSYNGKVAMLSLATIEEPKTGEINVAITGADGQVIETKVPVKAAKDGFVTVYSDNLQTYNVGKFTTDGEETSVTYNRLRINAAADQHVNWQYPAKAISTVGYAEIIEEEDGNRALKLYNNGAGNISATYMASENADKTQDSLLGKVVVLKTKYNMPATYDTNNDNGGAAASLAPNLTGANTASTPSFRLRDKGSLGYNSGDWTNNFAEKGWGVANDKWIDVVTVIDQTTEGTVTDPHTSRRYVDEGEGYNIHYVEAYDKSAGQTFADVKNMYDVAPMNYYGTWNFSGEIANLPSGKKSTNVFATNKFYGTYTALGTNTAAASNKEQPKAGYVLVDDFRAYYADKFAITYISDNKDAFVPTRHALTLLFNHPVDQAQADSIKLVNAAGEEVEGMVATLANGNYGIDFELPPVAKGDYKLVISPEFHDVESFQGLGSKNMDYEIPVTVTDYTAFTATVTPATIESFVSGKSAKAVVTLSAETSLVDSNAKEAFAVVNSKGDAVTDGWTADVADDQMSITLDFTDLETDSYTVTSNDKLVDKDGFALDSDPVSITIAPRTDKIMLIDEDFEEGFELEKDWLETAPEHNNWKAGRTKGTGVDNDAIVITDQLPEGAADAGISGKAMRIYAEQEATKVTKGITAKYAIDPIDIENTYPGKLLVMEVDVYAEKDCIADGSKPIIASFTKNLSPNNSYYKHNGNVVNKEGTWFSFTEAGHAGYAYHTRWMNGVSTKDDAGIHNVKFVQVIDQRNPMDVYKMYVDGKIAKEVSNTLLTDHPLYQQEVYEYPLNSNASADKNYWGSNDAGDFYGINIVAQTYSSTTMNTDMYIDNIKVYLVDPFEITSVEGASTAFNGAKDSVKFNFTNKVDIESAKENIKLVGADGNEVTNGLLFETAEGGYQLIAKLAAFENNATYKLVVSPYLKDEFGITIANKYKEYTYTSTGGSGYLVKHGAAWNVQNEKYDGKSFAWAATEEEANAIGGTKYPYTWTVAEGKVTLENPIAPGTAETFSANGWIVDKEAMKLETIIKLSKATSLFANAAAAVIEGNTVKTTLSFVNPEDNALPVWYIVAAYGDYNEMLGCSAASIEIEKGELNLGEVSFEVENASAIKSVKVYVWDGYKTMVPYQDAEDLLK